MPDSKHQIYFSYAWKDISNPIVASGEKMVEVLYQSLEAEGFDVIRGKESRGANVSEFVRQLDHGNMIVLAWSERFLMSEYCMFEFCEILQRSNLSKAELKERIYPLQLENLDLANPKSLTMYFSYWKNLQEEWEDMIDLMITSLGSAQQAHYDNIKSVTSNLTSLFSLLKSFDLSKAEPLCKTNFAQVKNQIKAQFEALHLKATMPGPKSDYDIFTQRQINGGETIWPDEHRR